MHNPSLLNQAVTANDSFSDIESSIGSSNDEFDQENNDTFTDLLDTKANDGSHSRKSKKQTSKSDAAKQALLLNEIFDYICTAKCRRFFLLAWYNNTTYSSNSKALTETIPKPLPLFCCNEPSCLSPIPKMYYKKNLLKRHRHF